MQWKINLTQVICLRIEKTTEEKTHWMNLRSPLLRIHYYQSQAITSIKNLTKPSGLSQNTNVQWNLYPNTQLDLYCSGNLSIQCTNPSTWLTNDVWIQYVTNSPTWRRLLAAKFFSSSTMKIRKLLGHKTLGVKTQ